MAWYAVEAFATRRGESGHPAQVARVREAVAEIVAEGGEVHYLTSLFVPADELCLHVFASPSAETVAQETLTLETIEEACPGRSVLLGKEWRVILPMETVDGNTPEWTLVTLPDLRFAGYWGELDVTGRSRAEIEVFIREGYHEGGWAFSPTVLVGEPGQRLDLTVRNPVGKGIYRTEHNFTLEEQRIDIDLLPGEEAVVTVDFPTSGSSPSSADGTWTRARRGRSRSRDGTRSDPSSRVRVEPRTREPK